MTEAFPLEITGLTKRFDSVTAVDGVDLRLDAGEIVALVGPSGCGKSTLLRSIAGLYAIDSGQIRLNGTLVDDGNTQIPPERRATGLVFQEHALFPHLSVRGNVEFGVRDLDRAATQTRVDEMLALVELGEHGDRFPHELSGGERQRVALARALAPRPNLMLFDEPFASLDHNLRSQLRVDVVNALRATNTAAVFVTHDQRESLAIGDRIAVMSNGKIGQLGTAEDVFHRPADTFVASFMGEASFLEIFADSDAARTALGPLDLAGQAASASVAMVRPDDVRCAGSDGSDGSDGSPAEIIAREYHGSDWLATARLDSGENVKLLTSHLEPLELGQRVSVGLVEGHRQVVLPRNPA